MKNNNDQLRTEIYKALESNWNNDSKVIDLIVDEQNEIYNEWKDEMVQMAVDYKIKFPNGFTSWIETHFQVVAFITVAYDKGDNDCIVNKTVDASGTGGLYELAEEWTDEFEKLYSGKEWDGEFFETIENYLVEKNCSAKAIDITEITDIRTAKEFIKKERRYVGPGFNPDTDFGDYVTLEKTYPDKLVVKGKLYSDEDAKKNNKLMNEAFEQFDLAGEDIYEFCISLNKK